MKRRNILALLMLFGLTTGFQARGQVPLQGAHAHNDYLHDWPLFDALSNGFTSIEVDVMLIDGKLYVGHNLPNKDHHLPTLDKAYLQPMDSIIKINKGNLYPVYQELCYLMIDIKTEAEATYSALLEALRPYHSWIRTYRNHKPENGLVSIFISGNRPIQTIVESSERWVSLDGRPSDLGKGYDSNLIPVISQSFAFYSRWDGKGQLPQIDAEKISQLASMVHLEGKQLRLWAIPDTPNSWALLRSLGVDIINTDDLAGFSKYRRGH